MGLLNLGMLVSIVAIAIAFLWIMSSAIGAYLPTEGWLLVIGATGLVCMLTYKKNKTND
jgi:hypothetical protein